MHGTRWVLVLALALIGANQSATAPLTLDEIFAPAPPWGSHPSKIAWSPDGTSFVYVLASQDPAQAVPLRQYDVGSGRSRIVIDPASYGAKAQTPANVAWSPDGRFLAFTERGTLFVRDMSTGLDRTIASDVDDVLWSPLGKALAFVRNADLYVANLEPQLRVLRLTLGGLPGAILNGGVDWVYGEEFSMQHGFAWSADGREIAYLQMDERAVNTFPLVDYLNAGNTVTYQRYPLAGDRNPRVSLRVADVTTLAARIVYDAGARDEYLPFLGWKPFSHTIVAELIDRSQQRVRIVQFDRSRAAPETIYQQRDVKWVDALPLPFWQQGGASLWILERDNVPGLYLRDERGRLKRLTGNYRVETLLGVNQKRQRAYVVAAYPTRRDRSLLAIPFDGGAPQNVTPAPGNHSVVLAPTEDLFVDTHSTLDDPPQTDLTAIDGAVRATIIERAEALRDRLLPTHMLSVDSSYGKLDALIIEPPDFDPSRKYPVVMYVYGGPESPTTRNEFGFARGLFHQVLARSGFVVFSIDGPASQIDNEGHVRLAHHNLGPASLVGQEIGASYLRSQPYVDSSRIGIWGWSFGGYEAAYALTHSTLFKAAVAGAPVTDWRFYDSIYTERYMGPPQNDPRAYDAGSVVRGVPNMHGSLLIVHGTSDDNVHLANTIALLQAAISAGKTNVDFMPYPRQKHAFAALQDLRDLYGRMLEWWSQHL